MNINQLMQQAQKMQKDMKKSQDEVAAMTFTSNVISSYPSTLYIKVKVPTLSIVILNGIIFKELFKSCSLLSHFKYQCPFSAL